MSKEFYNSNELLTKKDLNGQDPIIKMVCGNRTAGKTFNFSRYLVRRFLKHGEKFMYITRYKYDLDSVAESFFKPLESTLKEFNGMVMTGKKISNGLYYELLLNNIPCGYAVCLNSAESLKPRSGNFVDVKHIFFDEFMSETGKYLKNEVQLFQSLYTSVARGGGEHVRHVPVYMCSNNVSVLNPYFIAFGIHKRINSKVKFLRGNGWILEQTFNESASNAISTHGFAQAFEDSNYMNYATNNTYLLDNNIFVGKRPITGKIFFNLTSSNITYGVWEEPTGILYITEKYEKNFGLGIVYKLSDHTPNYLMIQKNSPAVKYCRRAFETGMVRFSSPETKLVFIEFLGFSLNDTLK